MVVLMDSTMPENHMENLRKEFPDSTPRYSVSIGQIKVHESTFLICM